MESINFESGDNNNASSIAMPFREDVERVDNVVEVDESEVEKIVYQDEITPQTIDNNETKLKDRIAQCRNVIESLKFELYEEKAKLEKETKTSSDTEAYSTFAPGLPDGTTSEDMMADYSYGTSLYSVCVENKLNCDENLMAYEKQLQKYQNTLNMAQIEKKNAIRKQMLAKAFKLKLMEVENQCNIELLRVKQSLQCLEPLKMIASKWNNGTSNDDYDYNTFELMMPTYPEISANSGCDINFLKDVDTKIPTKSEGDKTTSD